jgi:hypothetical protein
MSYILHQATGMKAMTALSFYAIFIEINLIHTNSAFNWSGHFINIKGMELFLK